MDDFDRGFCLGFGMTFITLAIVCYLAYDPNEGAIKHAKGEIVCEYIEFTDTWECKENENN